MFEFSGRWKSHFEKGHTAKWTQEIFIVRKVNNTVPVTYELEDEEGEEIVGRFYEMNSNTQTINKISYDNIKEMVIVRDFEKHKYYFPVHSVHGAGVIDTVKSVADFVSQNKDTFKDVSKAVLSVSSASSNIAQAIKAAKHFNELREARKLSPKVISELQTERNKKEDGFEKF